MAAGTWSTSSTCARVVWLMRASYMSKAPQDTACFLRRRAPQAPANSFPSPKRPQYQPAHAAEHPHQCSSDCARAHRAPRSLAAHETQRFPLVEMKWTRSMRLCSMRSCLLPIQPSFCLFSPALEKLKIGCFLIIAWSFPLLNTNCSCYVFAQLSTHSESFVHSCV